MTKVKCYVSVQVTYLLDIYFLGQWAQYISCRNISFVPPTPCRLGILPHLPHHILYDTISFLIHKIMPHHSLSPLVNICHTQLLYTGL